MEYPVMPQRRSEKDVLITKESLVKAPLEIVFDVITDLKLFEELEEGVKSVTITSEIKEGKGMKSHWVLQDQSTGEAWELDEEIIYSCRPYQYAYVGYAGGKDYSGVHTLTANPDGTTSHLFNEAFYFDVDPEVYDEVVGGMVTNVKKEAEKRAAAGK
ncbi:MAG: SRPBCC family protein [Spirochaetales bacterium]|nr:SRPBCC family protein [Spirochaetales bacterium]